MKFGATSFPYKIGVRLELQELLGSVVGKTLLAARPSSLSNGCPREAYVPAGAEVEAEVSASKHIPHHRQNVPDR